jgi:hypothetical protein
LFKDATTLRYQLPQGDEGASEDDNDTYKHDVTIKGKDENQTFVSQVLVNGTAV